MPCAIYIGGGGYPEVYAENFSSNTVMRDALLAAHQRGYSCLYPECGGLMCLGETLTDSTGNTFPMTGIIAGTALWVTD